ncbi:MAG: glycosyltransferase [Bacteroidota bacterium]
MAKIFVLNNYSLERVWQEIRDGKKPNHHLYGVNYLERAGHEIVLVPFDESKRHWLTRFSKFWKKTKLPIPLGDLYQQFYVLKKAEKQDIIYAPCQTQTALLSYWKALGLLRTKIIVVAHHPPIRGSFRAIRQFFFRWELAGTQTFPSLSQRISDKVNKFKQNKSEGLHWGPDLEFYEPYRKEEVGTYFLAAGRTGRDFATFATACDAAKVEAKIICLQNDYERHLKQYDNTPNIEITSNAAEQSYLYDQLTPVMAKARAICIPLFSYKSHLAGLTSLTDALALGKPVLMTRNNFIDIDIEKEGIGFWVEAEDEEGWKRALERLEDDELCREMGKKAEALASQTWNIEIFSEEILVAIGEEIAVLSQKEILRKTASLMEDEGKIYEKNKNVFARKAKGGEQIVTTTADGKETQNTAEKGEYIITNQTDAKEQYIVESKDFQEKYDWLRDVGEEKAEYRAKGEILALELTSSVLQQLNLQSPFQFVADWGEEMIAKEGDFLAQPLKGEAEVYRIARKEFFETYKLK